LAKPAWSRLEDRMTRRFSLCMNWLFAKLLAHEDAVVARLAATSRRPGA
jgi:hypothetical protein